MIAPTAVILPGVKLGERVRVEDYCILGVQPMGADGVLETVIGDDSVIRASTIIYAGNVIGSEFQTGNKANVRECNVIGDRVSIGTLTVVEHHVQIADDVRIHTHAFIPEYSTLGKSSWVGPHVVFTNALFPRSPSVKDGLAGPILEERAIIGANATLLPGVRIGARSLVGAGSVVTKDVPGGVIVAGSPARVLRSIDY